MSDSGGPVEGAHVSGGDHDWFWVDGFTDAEGYVQLPSYAVNWDASIQAANHYPSTVRPRNEAVFALRRTPVQLRLIGASAVYPVKFTNDTLIHLDYNGDLVTFIYDEAGMSEAARAHLAPRRRAAVLRNDTLWYTTHNEGIYAYDVSNPTNPHQAIHLPIDEYLGPIALLDSLVIVADPWEPGPVEIYVVRPDGTWNLLIKWGELIAQRFEVKNQVLMAYTKGEPIFTIISLVDPANPRQLFSWGNPYYSGVFRFGDTIVFTPAVGLSGQNFVHLRLDISNPLSPTWGTGLSASCGLQGLVNDTLGVASYGGQPALLTGHQPDRYRIIALGMGEDDPSAIGGTPPSMIGDFVLFRSHLWKIEPGHGASDQE